MDFRGDTDIFVALARLDDAPLGTMRVYCNDSLPPPLGQSFNLPKPLSSGFGLTGLWTDGLSMAVKTAMFKVYISYCLQYEIDFMIICPGCRVYILHNLMAEKVQVHRRAPGAGEPLVADFFLRGMASLAAAIISRYHCVGCLVASA
jgi:hypothetical protein